MKSKSFASGCQSKKSIWFAYCLTTVSIIGCVSNDVELVPLRKKDYRNFLDAKKIPAIHFEPRQQIWYGTFFTKDYGWHTIEDPLVEVKQFFINGLNKRISFKDFRPISQYRLNNNLTQLKRTYKSGFVLSFHTSRWKILPYKCTNTCLRLEYSAVARLVRVEREEITWQKECIVKIDDLYKGESSLSGHQIREIIIPTIKKDQVAENCANELLNDFLGER
jgi:hypothetical protein